MKTVTIWQVIEIRDTGKRHVVRACPDEDKARRVAAARRSVIRAKGLSDRTVRIEPKEYRTGGIYE